MNKTFEELGFKAGDTVVCTSTEYPGFYTVGQKFELQNRHGNLWTKYVDFNGSGGTWEKVSEQMKIGDKVRLSDKGKKMYEDCFGNPYNLKGKLVEPLTSLDDFVYRVEWGNGKTNSYRIGELELAEEKPKFYEEVITKKVKLNRGYIDTVLPSGDTFSTSGMPEFVTVVSQPEFIKNDDIPAIIEHLQQWYDAVQLEKGNKQ